jgi:hypothetical protein
MALNLCLTPNSGTKDPAHEKCENFVEMVEKDESVSKTVTGNVT